jgi:hypothetical protein
MRLHTSYHPSLTIGSGRVPGRCSRTCRHAAQAYCRCQHLFGAPVLDEFMQSLLLVAMRFTTCCPIPSQSPCIIMQCATATNLLLLNHWTDLPDPLLRLGW